MTAWVEETVRNMGYIGLALLTFIENIFPPIPSEVILPLGGFLVSQGQLTIWGVVLAGTVGSLAGAIVLYYLGRYFNRKRLEDWAENHGGWLLLTRGDVSGAFDWFEDHGGKAVFFLRMVPGFRSLISIPAGACRMDIWKFLLLTAAGTAIWSAALAAGGMLLGQQYSNLSQILNWAGYVVIGIVVISIIWWYVQRRREQSERDEQRGKQQEEQTA